MAAVAGFLENLFNSIFTPGPTPTLLVATNASFAALQLLFFVLLLATYSIHFVILSVLCGGLWWAINWFAAEIRELQAKDEEAKRAKEAKRDKDGVKDEDGMDSGDDTEVDTEVDQKKAKAKGKATQAQSQGLGKKPSLKSNTKAPRAPKPETQSTVFVEKPSEAEYPGAGRGREATPIQSSSGPTGASTTGASTRLEPLVDDALKKRKSLGESTGELSTDSEWEKLSQDSGDR
ncbi:Pkr1-domain-containing protein [Periconia macrospinosa]|uniref:Pkr1-domain-containing protein n=1 Tax=Periconia macrospinosa TaxID=97972 RepID=A0A2V1E8P9_9PLEO|nr:Pkr1-domain-containing protein [Periconia macrospinosa]